MVAFQKLFNTVLLAVLASSANALTVPANSKHATHQVRAIANGVKLETYNPKSTYTTFTDGLDTPLRKRGASLKETAMAFLPGYLKVNETEVGWTSGFVGDVSKHSYHYQQINGLKVANAVANVAWDSTGKVIAVGSSFVKPSNVADPTPKFSVEDAKKVATSALDGDYLADAAPTLQYLAQPDGSAKLVHVFQVRNNANFTWYNAFVDANTNELVSVTDFVAHATFRAIPVDKLSPDDGFEDIVNPEDLQSSPQGWVTNGQTVGNNVLVANLASGRTAVAPESSQDTFQYNHDGTQEPDEGTNLEAAMTNAFFLANTVHDVTYRYGFTEAAFNFQQDNFGKGGVANDPVLASVQDPSGTNNANFATPPDGQSGIMRMFIFTSTQPNRDGSLENDIPIHELTHGITSRLTGGGTGACLQTLEAQGLGEGWSDAVADWFAKTSADVNDFAVGVFVSGNAKGIRSAPYSTNSQVNPLTLGNVAKLNEVHNIGEVWANMLHIVYAELVKAHGFSATAKTDATGKEGNVVWMHLFIDSLAIQPCNPTFVSARDAWIQADKNRFNGENRCLLSKAFASRGLGANAKEDHIDNFDVLDGC